MSTTLPVSSVTTSALNTTSVTKSKEQILIQSSGAMIAIIVIGIIIILSILLIILKTYNRRTHATRMLGSNSTKPRKNTLSTAHTNLPMTNVHNSSSLGSFVQASSENGFHLPMAHVGGVERMPGVELFSTTSDSTIVTIHDTPSVENT